ncbi:autotransporter outer membrane beta-barrel domain-containing protein [Achromobacter seleniivolatilans]|uniref:Autotransporter outer membrane beta-barrel domain-containing protein n=1 Tax=Achromobacter seleniivolatilans TaxID=3047478 RepID=A0ABY9M207_9BURK|nr:autotransporter outer membrane beta-barrel domain-containing protein [Achromobacter sp. R39]WMD20233.1 autotransporter outer membrane beta-barrel domain-containing protein [Achromobacter sp. R39]
MKFHLTPLMAALLAASVPVFPAISMAAEIGQVTVSDSTGLTQRTLDPGSSITFDASGSALSVSVAGNSVTADNLSIKAGGPNSAATKGVSATTGGVVNLSNSSVNTLGVGQQAHGLYAENAGSVITATNTAISTLGQYSHGAYALGGGKIKLEGGSVSVVSNTATGLLADGVNSLITAKSLDISTNATGVISYAANAVNGGRIELQDVNTTGGQLQVQGLTSTLVLTDTNVNSGSANGINVDSGTLTMQGGSVSAVTSAVMVRALSGVKAGTANIKDATLTSTADFGYGINLNMDGSSATVENVAINALGASAVGVWMPLPNAAFDARNFSIVSGSVGIDNRAGRVTLNDGSITTAGANAFGLYASTTGAVPSTIATNIKIKTAGAGAVGAMSRGAGANISLTDSTVETGGVGASGLYTSGSTASMIATGTTITTSGQNSAGVEQNNLASLQLDNSKILTQGKDAHGLWSYILGSGAFTNVSRVTNGSVIETTDGIGLVATGSNHNIVLENSRVLARTGGVVDDGIAIQTDVLTTSTATYQTGQVNVDATGSTLTGSVLANSGVLDMTLNGGSTLTGAVVSLGGRVNSLSLDNSSVWNVRGNSNLGTLNNAGTVSFVSPNANAGFKTLTVNNYVGGGTLVMNTQLGDDASPTDKLVIDGGTTSGVTSMRVINSGGVGAQTDQGIRLVETINGGTTTTDAFHLDTGSTGFRASSGTVAIKGYDYSLVRGGNQGVAADWYLTSVFDPTYVDPETETEKPYTQNPPQNDPVYPGGPFTPPDLVLPPDAPVVKNVSPESGAYVGNQLAASRMFMHGLHDRVIARAPLAGDNTASLPFGGWARVEGSHDGKLRMSEGKVSVDTDRSIIHLGGDVLYGLLPNEGLAVAGVMAGYGDARVTSTSRLMVPGTNQSVDAKARGKVSGYSVGLYATVYGNVATGLGPYADSWLQYGRYSNQINSELGSARYHSNVWTASLEAGYAVQPFSSSSALGAVVLVPQAQVAYTHYDAARATLQGMEMTSDSPNAVSTRVGVRVYPQGKADAASLVRPFLETNWLHNSGNPSVNMGGNSLSAAPMRNAAELKLGAEGRIGKSLYLSGQVSGQMGSGDQRGYGGMLNINYRW